MRYCAATVQRGNFELGGTAQVDLDIDERGPALFEIGEIIEFRILVITAPVGADITTQRGTTRVRRQSSIRRIDARRAGRADQEEGRRIATARPA
jgi:hypothetical protein